MAMILAAGIGMRLKPLTENLPKALLAIDGEPLLGIVIKRLIQAGFRQIVVNVHHHAELVLTYLRCNDYFGIRIIVSDESSQLLDTGGAIKRASPMFGDEQNILIHNVDILTNLDLSQLYQDHLVSEAGVTLVTKNRPTSRYILIDGNNRFCGWENPSDNIRIVRNASSAEINPIAFSGVYVLNRMVFSDFPEADKFGLFNWLLNIADHQRIVAWNQGNTFWYEVGRIESLNLARERIAFQGNHPDLLIEKRP